MTTWTTTPTPVVDFPISGNTLTIAADGIYQYGTYAGPSPAWDTPRSCAVGSNTIVFVGADGATKKLCLWKDGVLADSVSSDAWLFVLYYGLDGSNRDVYVVMRMVDSNTMECETWYDDDGTLTYSQGDTEDFSNMGSVSLTYHAAGFLQSLPYFLLTQYQNGDPVAAQLVSYNVSTNTITTLKSWVHPAGLPPYDWDIALNIIRVNNSYWVAEMTNLALDGSFNATITDQGLHYSTDTGANWTALDQLEVTTGYTLLCSDGTDIYALKTADSKVYSGVVSGDECDWSEYLDPAAAYTVKSMFFDTNGFVYIAVDDGTDAWIITDAYFVTGSSTLTITQGQRPVIFYPIGISGNYAIEVDSVEVATGTWTSGVPIEYNSSGLAVAEYEVVCILDATVEFTTTLTVEARPTFVGDPLEVWILDGTWQQLSGAVEISVDNKTDAKSMCQWLMPKSLQADMIAYRYYPIRILVDDTIIWEGHLSQVIPTPKNIVCKGMDIASQLEWHVLTPTEGTFIEWEGTVDGAPAGTTLDVAPDDEGEAAWVADEHENRYVVISDNNTGDSDQAYDESPIGQADSYKYPISNNNWQEENTYASVGSGIGNTAHWGIYVFSPLIPVAPNNIGLYMSLQTENYELNKTIIPKHLHIMVDVGALTGLNFHPNSQYIEVWWQRDDPADNLSDPILLDNWQVHPNIAEQRHTFMIDIDIADPTVYFVMDGDAYVEGGWLKLIYRDRLGSVSFFGQRLRWYGCDVTLTYRNTVYKQLNVKIASNTNAYALTAVDDAGDAVDFNAENVGDGDKVTICAPITEAIAKIGVGGIGGIFQWAIVSLFDDPQMGYPKNLIGVNSFEALIELATHLDKVWFVDYRNSYLAIATRSNLPYEYMPVTGYRTYNLGYEDQDYHLVVIYWKDGIVTSYGGGTGPGIYKEVRADLITKTDAQAYADTLSAKFATTSMSIELVYDHFVWVNVGYRVASITIDGITYTNQMIRRVTYQQDGAKGSWTTTIYLGRAQTPPDEKLGRILGLLDRKIHMLETRFLT